MLYTSLSLKKKKMWWRKLTDDVDSLIFCSTMSRAQNPSSRKVNSKSLNEVMATNQIVIAKETIKKRSTDVKPNQSFYHKNAISAKKSTSNKGYPMKVWQYRFS